MSMAEDMYDYYLTEYDLKNRKMATLSQFVKEFGMTKLTGRIDNIKKDTVKSGKSEGKAYYRVTLDSDQLLIAWSWEAIKDVKKGKQAEFTVEQKGNFPPTILSSIPIIDVYDDEPDDIISDEPEEEVEEKKEFKKKEQSYGEKYTSNNPYISRMSAIKSSVDLFSGNLSKTADMDEVCEDIIVVAKRFLDFINEGE